jgi:hypothetical protein
LKKDKKRSSITSWIQAAAAAISIPAAIIVVHTFFQKDEDLQRQISSLDTISRQSIIQTEILTKQVELLRDEQDFLKAQNELSQPILWGHILLGDNINSCIMPCIKYINGG